MQLKSGYDVRRMALSLRNDEGGRTEDGWEQLDDGVVAECERFEAGERLEAGRTDVRQVVVLQVQFADDVVRVRAAERARQTRDAVVAELQVFKSLTQTTHRRKFLDEVLVQIEILQRRTSECRARNRNDDVV